MEGTLISEVSLCKLLLQTTGNLKLLHRGKQDCLQKFQAVSVAVAEHIDFCCNYSFYYITLKIILEYPI